MSIITDAIKQMAHAYRLLGAPTADIYQVVLDHGREYTAAPLPDDVGRATPKQCFQNAINIADDTDLIYTEGYVLRPGAPMLIHHAWLVTPDGVVVDPTLSDPETCAYYGIEFQVDWVVSLGYLGLALERYVQRLHAEGRL